MKRYEVSYTREGSKIPSRQVIMANSKAEAKAKFMNLYRNCKILAIFEK